jgi:hypothetical protein
MFGVAVQEGLIDPDASRFRSASGHLCRQLGGIPLAIELAASRIDVFEAAELAALGNESSSCRSDNGPSALSGPSRVCPMPQHGSGRSSVAPLPTAHTPPCSKRSTAIGARASRRSLSSMSTSIPGGGRRSASSAHRGEGMTRNRRNNPMQSKLPMHLSQPGTQLQRIDRDWRLSSEWEGGVHSSRRGHMRPVRNVA